MPKNEAPEADMKSGSETELRIAISDEIGDQPLAGYKKPDDLLGPGGLIKQLMGRLINRAMNAELSHHLGYGNGEVPPENQNNRRNGTSAKTLRTDAGRVTIDVPRNRSGSFEPKIVGKHERHFDGFDDKILSMYARGMSVRDIRAHLAEIYGIEVSPELISRVTDAVVDELRLWQSRPLDPVYLVIYLDALFVKIRDKGVVRNKAVYSVVGLGPDGKKDVLGLWIQNTEGAKFWLSILTELRQRGVQDALIMCADGLTGLPDAIEAAFPAAIFQTCIVHMVRSSTRFVPWKGPQGGLRRPQTNLHGRFGGRRGTCVRGVRNEMGKALPDDCRLPAIPLGRDHSLPGIPRGISSRDLHDQCEHGAVFCGERCSF